MIRLLKIALLLAAIAAAPAVLSAQQCGVQTIHGTYAFHYTSGLPGTPTYGVGTGVASFDFGGKGAATETVSINGTIVRGVKSLITYTVNADCTGTITWTYPDFGNLVVKGDLVVADNGKKIFTIGTDDKSISQGTYERQ